MEFLGYMKNIGKISHAKRIMISLQCDKKNITFEIVNMCKVQTYNLHMLIR